MANQSRDPTSTVLGTSELLISIFEELNLKNLLSCSQVCTAWKDIIDEDTPATQYPQRLWLKGYEEDGLMKHEINPALPQPLQILDQSGDGNFFAGTVMLRDHCQYPREPGGSEKMLLVQPPITSLQMGMQCGPLEFCGDGDDESLCKRVGVWCGPLTIGKFLGCAEDCMADHRKHCSRIDGSFKNENQALSFTLTRDEDRKFCLAFQHDQGHLSARLDHDEGEVKGLKRKVRGLEKEVKGFKESGKELKRKVEESDVSLEKQMREVKSRKKESSGWKEIVESMVMDEAPNLSTGSAKLAEKSDVVVLSGEIVDVEQSRCGTVRRERVEQSAGDRSTHG
ncbi:F-box associated region [Elasticomyces elasticus]|nr:F-box associated region [Elasticomyces elasticus]